MSHTPIHESNLPAVLNIQHMAALMGTSVRCVRRRMLSRNWPYQELARVDRNPRWSRDAVLAVINRTAMRPMRLRA